MRLMTYIQHQFCWKDSYGRGVGTIPNDCGQRHKIGLLCYDHCPQGYSRFGFDCHQQCPPGFRNDGLFCRHAQYGRGAGFPWKFGDGFNDRGMYSRCQAKHGNGNCQKTGLIVYPKCKPGYHNFGCCICRPPKPNCQALGMNGAFDLSCAKKLQIGKPHSANCPPEKEYDTGLCYKRCREGYYGVGPVCWANTPNGWVGCGMGSAKTSKACAGVIFGQIASIGQIAMNIATFGGSGSATAAARSTKNLTKIGKLKQKLSTLKKAVKGNKAIAKVSKLAKQTKKARKAGQKIKEGYEKAADAADALQELETLRDQNVTEADIVRISAQIAALADPTGIASAVEAYSHPKCSQIFRK